MKKNLKKSKNTGRSRYPSWLTTDRHEIELRQKRAFEEPMLIQKLVRTKSSSFTDYIVKRKDTIEAKGYKVEVRSLINTYNHCTCPDFSKSFLGTCKHIEKVISKAKPKNKKSLNSPFVEIFLDYSDNAKLKVLYPDRIDKDASLFMNKYLDAEKNFKKPVDNTLQVFLRDMEKAHEDIYNHIRVSEAVINLNNENIFKASLKRIKKQHGNLIKEDALNGRDLKYPLYDYQVDGMLHLAFSGRAMLADEMGLGKTVQAVAASAIMQKHLGVKRVMVVSPASLKTEWEEQISKFTDLEVQLVFGLRKERLKIYQKTNAFFILTNYEQIRIDCEEINDLLQPDLIILDEAQRIKNWKTKTAKKIKRLNSRYAFILTGTPIENRIDELYSLTEFLDPRIFGSLFRFNREYYNFNDEGKTEGFKNLRKLHYAIKPIMLRRRKDEISEQLPERIDNNYFVKMTLEQHNRYEDHAQPVRILMNIAGQRPLSQEEFDKLQLHLSCMRMLCDSVYILDQTISEAPKIDELIKILNDIWDNRPDRKVIIFSEWVRMLHLVREQLEDNKVKFSWHVGSVPQAKRREEINNFKNDPECKVFLSSDSGGLGLNLQVASVVINMDLPWNPAKLEQRIARAWRKHQKSTVNVINLISEETIEHNMLGTLSFKQGLADGVLDARGDIDELEKPNAKNAFMERLASIMKTSFVKTSKKDEVVEIKSIQKQPPKEEVFRQEIELNAPRNLKICNGVIEKDTGDLKGVFAVSNCKDTKEKLGKIAEKTNLNKEENVLVINDETYELLQQLSNMGVISFNDGSMKEIYKTKEADKKREQLWEKKQKLAKTVYTKAERSFKMAQVLKNGGFDEESINPLIDSVKVAAKSLFILANKEFLYDEPKNLNKDSIQHIKATLNLNENLTMFLMLCCTNQHELSQASIDIHNYAQRLHQETEILIAGQGV